jgi:hypothetical protein
MAIEGPLRELGIHDVFQLLDLSRKTGRLRVTSVLRNNEGTVFFKDGRVISAYIKSNPHPLGALLVRAGKLTEADLARARNAQMIPGESRRLGEIMVSLAMVTRRDLERYVRQQIEVVVFELLSWQEGFFSFAEEDLPSDGAEGVTSVTTESLLMEGARRLDEWERVQQRIPHLGMIPALSEGDGDYAPHLELRPGEWEVLAMIDGTTDLRGVAAALGRSEFDVARVVFGLLTTGIITCNEPRRSAPRDDEERELGKCLTGARDALLGNRIDEALALATSAVRLGPGSAESRMTLARVLFRAGRDAEAEGELQAALANDPAHASALMEIARLAARRGELQRGIALWQKVIVNSPDSPLAEQARSAVAHASRLTAVLEAVDVG